MDVSELVGQFLFDATAVCVRPTVTFLQGDASQFCNTFQIVSAVEGEPNEEDYSNTEGEGDELELIETKDKDKEEDDKKQSHRTRYSREEYRCVTCPYTCTTEKAYFRHLRQCEAGETLLEKRRFSCPVCGKDRRDEINLNTHMTKHKSGKYICCDLCKFKSVQLKKIIQHRRMHTGEKPHLCPNCRYRSSRRDNLRSHVRRVHKQDNLNCDTFIPQSTILMATKHKTGA